MALFSYEGWSLDFYLVLPTLMLTLSQVNNFILRGSADHLYAVHAQSHLECLTSVVWKGTPEMQITYRPRLLYFWKYFYLKEKLLFNVFNGIEKLVEF